MKTGVKAQPKYISVKNVQENIQIEERKSLLAYHCVTGCDTTSALSGFTKKSSWQIFKNHFPLLTSLGSTATVSEEQFSEAEKFVILMYTEKKPGLSNSGDLDILRASMFKSIRELEKLPPTRQTFRLHIDRVNHQILIWRNAHVAKPHVPNPTENGWTLTESGNLVPVTSHEPAISMKDLELISCQCKAGCRSSRCGCSAKKQNCMEGVCHVGYKCFNEYNYAGDENI